jgi:hypothetical protein
VLIAFARVLFTERANTYTLSKNIYFIYYFNWLEDISEETGRGEESDGRCGK